MFNLLLTDEIAECFDKAAFDGWVLKDLLMRNSVGVVNPEPRLFGIPWTSKIVTDQSGLRTCDLHPATSNRRESAFERGDSIF